MRRDFENLKQDILVDRSYGEDDGNVDICDVDNDDDEIIPLPKNSPNNLSLDAPDPKKQRI